MKFTVPVKTKNPLNENQFGQSGFARARVRKKQRETTHYVWLATPGVRPTLPCTVLLTRVAPRKLDSHDGLRASLKAIVDQVAEELGLRTDSDPRVTWTYAQMRGKPREYGVEVEIA